VRRMMDIVKMVEILDVIKVFKRKRIKGKIKWNYLKCVMK
jgi:hypothetical protein